jgi:hypothetical protein
MSDGDLKKLSNEHLQERRAEALQLLAEAQNAYNAGNPNLSGYPSGRMPVTPISELQALDEALESTGAAMKAIDEEIDRRGSGKRS